MLLFPWLRPYSSNKLDPRSHPCIFLGYCAGVKGYRCLNPITKRVYISRHVRFLENDFPYQTLVSHSSHNTSSIPSSFSSPSFVIPSSLTLPLSPVPIVSSSTLVHVSPSPIQYHNVPLSNNTSQPSSSTVPPSSSSILPSPVISTHSMVTRSKHGITVPKKPLSLLVQSPPTTESLSVKEAMSFSEW